MKKVVYFIILFSIQTMTAQNETIIYLIRHAEKADGSPNTELSEEGRKRANNWAILFKDIPIDLFYSTPYIRTQDTCLPLASSRNKEIIYYKPHEMDLKKLIAKHPGKTIFIVGHSNTITRHVNNFLGEEKYDEIPEPEFGNLYTIKVIDGLISHSLTRM